MAEGGGTEKQLLGQFVQKQTKYGTTTRLVSKSSIYIKHKVEESDTLMGIALKYGATVEQVKRENKLWTNDSLFLREHLLIPVAQEDVCNIPTDCEVIEIDNACRKRSGTNSSTENRSRSNSHVTPSENDTESEQTNSEAKETTGLDFLNRFDSSIAQIKSNVKKLESNARFLEDDFDNPLSFLPRKNSNSSSKQIKQQKSSSAQKTTKTSKPSSQKSSTSAAKKDESQQNDMRVYYHDHSSESSPVLVVKSRNSSRKVQTSLDRLEMANDDLFQL